MNEKIVPLTQSKNVKYKWIESNIAQEVKRGILCN